MKKIIIISLIVHAILIAILAPWMKTRMEFDTAVEAERTEEVRKRELARQEHDRLKRDRQKLDAETAKKLKREAEKTKKAKLERQLDELRDLREEILDRQKRELAKLQEREMQDIVAAAKFSFQQQVEDLKDHVSKAVGVANRGSFVVGGYQNGYERSAKGLIDNVRIYLTAAEPPFGESFTHQFNFDGDAVDSVSKRAGTIDNGAELVESPDSGGQALLGNGLNSRAEFWPINLGGGFTLVGSVKLEAKTDRPQVIFANSHSGENNRGFRFYLNEVEEGAETGVLTFSTTSDGEEGQLTKSTPGAFRFGQWHEVAVVVDKQAGRARIFIDGNDATAPDAKMAEDFTSDATTLDGSELEMAAELEESLTEDASSPENLADFQEDVEEMKEKLELRMDENPGQHAVRGELSAAIRQAEKIQEALTDLMEKTDINQMNDTSSSVADKMSPDPAPADATPAELYREASEIEQQISEAYADVSAAAKAASENSSYENARADTKATTPSRPDLAGDLSANEPAPKTVGELSEFRRNLDRAANEVSDMASRARGLLDTADNRSLTQSREFNGSSFASSAARMAAASAQYQHGAVVDMTGGFGAGGGGNSQEMRSDKSSEGSSMAAADGKQEVLHLDDRKIMAKALPGRRFTEKSLRSGWLYLDTWYLIGPWENRSNVNFEDKHQPEQEIDFDAVYEDGKFADRPEHSKRLLKWEFYQSDSVRCQPPEVYGASTYYAYTEVWFEEDRDMLIAVASDDAASVWLNDKIIWQDRGQSAWQLGEGYRRVHFRKGYNDLLVRIENGPSHCVWSVLLCPPEIMK